MLSFQSIRFVFNKHYIFLVRCLNLLINRFCVLVLLFYIGYQILNEILLKVGKVKNANDVKTSIIDLSNLSKTDSIMYYTSHILLDPDFHIFLSLSIYLTDRGQALIIHFRIIPERKYKERRENKGANNMNRPQPRYLLLPIFN